MASSYENHPAVTPQDLLEKLMYDGTFDMLRSSLIAHLKANEDMKTLILTSVEQSEVLRTQDAEKKSKRQLMEELRNELSTSVLDKASAETWKLMLAKDGVGIEIIEKVDATFCELTGASTLGCDCHPNPDLTPKESGSNGCDCSSSLRLMKEDSNAESENTREEKQTCEVGISDSKPEDISNEGMDEKSSEEVQKSNLNSKKLLQKERWKERTEDVQNRSLKPANFPSRVNADSIMEDVQMSIVSPGVYRGGNRNMSTGVLEIKDEPNPENMILSD